MATAWRIPLCDLSYDEREEHAVADVIRSRWLTMGPRTAEFESRLADYLGVRHAVAVANCTAALELAFRIVCQVAPQAPPLVPMPTLTFVATANAAAAAGLMPVLVDSSSPTDPRISLSQVEEFLAHHQVRCLCTMHYAGFDAGSEALRALADRHGVLLVEDAAHAIGGRSAGGQKLGAIGHIGCFSFFSNKNLATGEGGALVTNDDDIAHLARLLRSHGMTSGTTERHYARTGGYDVLAVGHNMRWNELAAALGIVQLAKLEAGNERRRALYRRYAANLADATGVAVLLDDDALVCASAAHICVAVFASPQLRAAARAALHAAGIQTSHHYQPIHTFTAWRDALHSGAAKAMPCPNAEQFASRSLTLPLFPALTESAVDEICDVIRAVVAGSPDCSA
jgi:dTDP-4-amino-4,6-dideoxygalactose transaminase